MVMSLWPHFLAHPVDAWKPGSTTRAMLGDGEGRAMVLGGSVNNPRSPRLRAVIPAGPTAGGRTFNVAFYWNPPPNEEAFLLLYALIYSQSALVP